MFGNFRRILRKQGSNAKRPDDTVLVLLSPGEANPTPERLEQLGLTADARRVREQGYNP